MFNILICDDNIEFANILESKIKLLFNELHMDFSIRTISKNFENINYVQYDLFLLDVEMGKINGIDLGQRIRKSNQDAIIVYISSFLHYALFGYRVKAAAYLLKEDPNFDNTLNITLKEILGELTSESDRMLIKTDDETVRVKLKEVIYIESDKRKVIFHLTDGKKIETYSQISSLDKELGDKGFLRIQKGYLANMRHIMKISSYKAHFDNGEIIRTTDNGYSEIIQKFTLWKGKL